LIDQMQWQWESDRLRKTHAIILDQLREAESELIQQQSETLTLQSQMWEEVGSSLKSTNDGVLSGQYLDALRLNHAIKQDQTRSVLALHHMEEHAYFGRVDFKRKGSEAERSTYIGISTLYDPETREILVCDWRAPISSLFYENVSGETSYEGPDGSIRGTLNGKRQYKCEHEHLVYCLDSTLTIQDEILRETLSQHGDSRMHTIVSTIQRHQNRIICEDIRSRVAVQGVAGSGKTAVALHRVAWLLYRYQLDYRQILFLTPNRAFVSYIRDVLPELGEQNVPTSTLFDETLFPIPSRFQVETPWDATEERLELAGCPQGKREAEMRALLGEQDVWKMLLAFVQEKSESLDFPDFVFEGEVIGKRRSLKHLYLTRSGDMPMGKRVLRVIRLLTEEISQLYEKKIEEQTTIHRAEGYRKKEARILAAKDCQEIFRPLTQQMRDYLTLSTQVFFAQFLEYLRTHHPRGGQLHEYLMEWWGKRALNQEMATLYTALRTLVHGAPTHHYRHVLLDEVQNYTPVQVRLLELLYAGCGMTVLMDQNQHMNTCMPIGSWDFCDHKLEMDICYRSTRELTEFTRAFLPNPEAVKPFEREGSLPRVIHLGRPLDAPILSGLLRSLEDPGRVAVITRTRREALRLYDQCKDTLKDLRLLSANDRDPASTLSIVPSWLCQGLEFDTVLAVDPGAYLPEERLILYTVTSRAQHHLLLLDPGTAYAPPAERRLWTEEKL